MQQVYEISLEHLTRTRLFDLSSEKITPNRFRFIDCQAFIQQGVLRLVDSETVLGVSYSAISYVWRGCRFAAGQQQPSRVFSVCCGEEDAEPGEPINLDVLQAACIAACQVSLYLWLDQLCILQTNAKDKSWQIKNMQRLYKECKSCIVIPGGLSRLVSLQEETVWIQRAWTLQEAVTRSTMCLFLWNHGSARVGGLTDGEVKEVEEGRSAMMELGKLLQAAYVGHLRVLRPPRDPFKTNVKIFGAERDCVLALMAVMELTDGDSRETAIWRSALMRTSSRPVDMVLSIMGLFDVTLDPDRYGKQDRERATIDLARAIMASGRGATWLLASLGSSYLHTMCTMPSFPETRVDGGAEYMTPDGPKRPWEVIGRAIDWAVTPTPRGCVDGWGCLTFAGKFAAIAIMLQSPGWRSPTWIGFESVAVIRTQDGLTADADISGDHSATHAVVLGEVRQFALPATAARASRRSTVVMLLSPGEETWQQAGFAVIEKEFTTSWENRQVAVGSSGR